MGVVASFSCCGDAFPQHELEEWETGQGWGMKTDEAKYKGNLETDLSQTLETGVDIATPKDPKRTARAIL